MDGSTTIAVRARLMDDFNTNPAIAVFLLTTKVRRVRVRVPRVLHWVWKPRRAALMPLEQCAAHHGTGSCLPPAAQGSVHLEHARPLLLHVAKK